MSTTTELDPTEKLENKQADVKVAPTTDGAIHDPAPQSKKSVIIERLILCTALFFPLFLATLDTSTPLELCL